MTPRLTTTGGPPPTAVPPCRAAAGPGHPGARWADACGECLDGRPSPEAGAGDPALAGLLQDAMRCGGAGLSLHYQPLVDLATRALLGFEALLRWRLPDGLAVSPVALVGLAQAHGFAEALDGWVLERAVQDCAPWLEQRQALRISVNVSSGLLGTPGAVAQVQALLDVACLPASCLRLEVTEVMMLDALTARALGRLRTMGVAIAIDDFGTGQSSLARLLQLRVDEVKLDRSFLAAPCGARYRDLSFLRAVAGLAHARDARVVVEGIEAAEDEALARAAGCDIGQGYWYAGALPMQACAEMALAVAPPWGSLPG